MLLLITEPSEKCLAKKLVNQLINQTNTLYLSQSTQLALVSPLFIHVSIHSVVVLKTGEQRPLAMVTTWRLELKKGLENGVFFNKYLLRVSTFSRY